MVMDDGGQVAKALHWWQECVVSLIDSAQYKELFGFRIYWIDSDTYCK